MTDVRNSHFTAERVTPPYWRVPFDHGPINTVTADTVAQLSELVDDIERDDDLTVVVFTSRNPEFARRALRLRQPRRARRTPRGRDRTHRAPSRVLRQAGHRGSEGLRRRDDAARGRRAPTRARDVLRLDGAPRDPGAPGLLAAHGLGTDSELERRLGALVTLATAPADGA